MEVFYNLGYSKASSKSFLFNTNTINKKVPFYNKKSGFKTVVGYAELTTQFPIMPEAKKLNIKLIADFETGIIIGGQIVSGEPVTGKIDLLTYAIQNRSTIKDLAKLSYSAQPFQSFFPAANAVVLAAEDILNKI